MILPEKLYNRFKTVYCAVRRSAILQILIGNSGSCQNIAFNDSVII